MKYFKFVCPTQEYGIHIGLRTSKLYNYYGKVAKTIININI